MIEKKLGFTMLELVFVIVILGALAGTATTWLLQTRYDSQVAMTRADVATILKQVPARVFAENVQITNTPPNGYSSWGDWLMDTPSLDKSKWKPTTNGLVAIAAMHNNSNTQGSVDTCDGDYLYLNVATGQIYFIPKKIDTKLTFCRLLAKSYDSSATNRIIDLTTNQKTVF